MANASQPGGPLFPEILARHYRQQSTGTLLASCPPFRKKVYLRSGRVVFAGSDDHNDRLGEMLLRRGVLGGRSYYQASALISPGKRLGTLLVEMGLITPEQLVWAVKEQVKEIVFSLFHLSEKDCEFMKGAEGGDEIITLSINTPELLRLGAERMDRIVPALERFRSLDLYITLKGSARDARSLLRLEPSEYGWVELAARGATLAEILDSAGDECVAALKLLWVLDALELIDIGGAGGHGSPKEEDLGITAEDLSSLGR